MRICSEAEGVFNDFVGCWPKYKSRVISYNGTDLKGVIAVHLDDGFLYTYLRSDLSYDFDYPRFEKVGYLDSDDLYEEDYLKEFAKRCELMLLNRYDGPLCELARDIGVTTRTIYHWRTGRNVPSLTVLRRIAEVCQCEIEDLVHWKWTE